MKKMINVNVLKTELNKLVDNYVENETIDTEINNILYKYIPELIDKLAEEVDSNGDILDTNYKDPMVNKIKELDFGEEFDMKVHNEWRTYKITKSELCEDELDVVCITDDNIVYDIGYVDMKDVKESFIEDYKEGIIEDIKLEG